MTGTDSGGPEVPVTPTELFVARNVRTIIGWIGAITVVIIGGAVTIVSVFLSAMNNRIDQCVSKELMDDLKEDVRGDLDAVKDRLNLWSAGDLPRSICTSFPEGAYDSGSNVCAVKTRPLNIPPVFTK
jgi:hypothetical protein